MGAGGERLETATEIGRRYAVTKFTVLKWLHAGVIPAELEVGRVIRFSPAAVEVALGRRTAAAAKARAQVEKAGTRGKLPKWLPVI